MNSTSLLNLPLQLANTPSGVEGQMLFKPLVKYSLRAGPKRLPVWSVKFVYWMFVYGDAEGLEAALVAFVGAVDEVLVWGSGMLLLVGTMDEVLVWRSELLLLVGRMDEVLV